MHSALIQCIDFLLQSVSIETFAYSYTMLLLSYLSCKNLQGFVFFFYFSNVRILRHCIRLCKVVQGTMSQKLDKLKVPETSSWYIRIFPTYERGSGELRVWTAEQDVSEKGESRESVYEMGQEGVKNWRSGQVGSGDCLTNTPSPSQYKQPIIKPRSVYRRQVPLEAWGLGPRITDTNPQE